MKVPILLIGTVTLGSAVSPSPADGVARTATSAVGESATWQRADTLHLAGLQTLAIARDARADRADLERQASGLRNENLGVGRLPQFLLRGDAAYQSEVIEFAGANPGFNAPTPPKDRYELALQADWTLWDGGLIGAREAVEEARLSSAIAGLDAEIFGTRVDVTDAFFSALLLQEQIREVGTLIEDLEARLGEMQARVDQGLALAGAMASLRAELLGAGQRRDALSNERRVALGVLSRLIGRAVDDSEVLALPDLSAEMAARPVEAIASETVTSLPLGMRIHPQFAAFDAQRVSGDRQAEAITVTARPSVSVFGQLGYGSPGYDQFNDSLHEYWRAGVRVQWAPWTWNRRTREVEEIHAQQRMIDASERHFSDQLLRALERPMRTMEYMRTALDSDDDIIALREEAEAHARAQFDERAISVSDYTDARTDLQEARIARLRHRAELARAQALYLITLGVELR